MARDLSPAEEIVEAAAPRSLSMGLPQTEDDLAGEAIRPWQPKGEKDLEAPPKITVEGEELRGSPPPPRTAGGNPPGTRTPIGKHSPDI